ncbi:UDP-N-acetylmuramoyl-L-alanyl-D-glutamate--2,6-diaminopimelate ligase [Pseudoclavibacter chungangensis]|uniref:UDP-N-acetylmuramyl-tripeptide synthetase n=1 Tax=Pseudoclavibacter chungangensis TaxID=587635 RepID=A0A7J5C1D8_9MICO|nr:UDP-N-acetylmuramoyl-L-alanyl-D-glutamate--2,6-diaminopimelate ligase [Pseudoclavibacter chungangensis]KAB1662441.1 UDP-N-acetylmuramoyl-L-alanyl-D-glutamate--2,6-diaminopimelate ligase [Pseudoclavibacter chungangensis]NYJ68472.1 UDP-N-acetylmuramoyl-L-alanyl-D-glutamate--2,6-diaminopimelate ligase [Pseudoclavibacter chungangensis]
MLPELARPTAPRPVPLTTVGAAVDAESVIGGDGVVVTGVTSDSRRVLPGDLYVAVPGARVHGAQFAEQAREAGAAAVLTDADGSGRVVAAGLPVVVVPHPRATIAPAAAAVYGTATNAPTLFAVTGTNGKTTTTYLVRALLESLGMRAGLSGTVERVVGERSVETRHSGRLTTPEADYLHGLVARMAEDGVEAAAIEVSSHGLDGNRVDELPFEVSIFTNLSQDHLDVYGTMERYFESKMALFRPEHTRRGVIMLDGEWGRRAASEARVPVTTVATAAGPDAEAADWTVRIDHEVIARTDFTLVGPDGVQLRSSIALPGAFTAIDLSLAVVALVESGISLDRIRYALDSSDGLHPSVPGRLDLVSMDSPLRVYVDYGHTEASFRAVLHALRPFTPGRLFMVFGADGDRDRGKRPAMARAASEETDVVIVTDYNPRTEDPASIRATLLETIRTEFPEREVHEVPEPGDGIRLAIELARPGDLVFVGGHGHRADVEVGGRVVPFSARAVAVDALREFGWLDTPASARTPGEADGRTEAGERGSASDAEEDHLARAC